MSTVTARPDRQGFLLPYLERLAALDGHAERPGVPSRINVGSRSFLVEAWERGVVLGLLAGGEAERGWPGLLAHGVALQVKSLSDLERLGRLADDGSAGDEAELREELTIDTAHGLAMMAELQWAVDRLVVAGEIDPARKLTRFRNKLGHQLGELKEALGEEGLGAAECLAAELRADAEQALAEGVSPEGEANEERSALLSLERRIGTREDRQLRPGGVILNRSPMHRPRRSLLLPLATVLVVAVVAWVVIVLRPMLTRVELPVFSVADFHELPIVADVVAKPPALYVKVDEREWRSLSEEERRKAVAAIGRRIATAEYTGANLTDSNGRAVARWLKHSGVKLIEP